jgi:hypothetical protein
MRLPEETVDEPASAEIIAELKAKVDAYKSIAERAVRNSQKAVEAATVAYDFLGHHGTKGTERSAKEKQSRSSGGKKTGADRREEAKQRYVTWCTEANRRLSERTGLTIHDLTEPLAKQFRVSPRTMREGLTPLRAACRCPRCQKVASRKRTESR